MNLDINLDDLDSQFEEEKERIKKIAIMKMQRIGEMYSNISKNSGNYKDQTGNLRSANGYGIKDNGSIIKVESGRNETNSGIQKQETKAEVELIIGNGMDYCSHVEAKGYDVVSTGIITAKAEAKKQFK